MGADVVDVVMPRVVDAPPYSNLVREFELTDNQKARWELLSNNPSFMAVSGELLKQFGGYGVYGGTALLLEVDKPIRNRFYVPVAEDIVTSPWGFKFDLQQNADIDLVVGDIRDAGELATRLGVLLGDEYTVTVSNPDDYPRVDISLDGVEVMSVSDLKSGAEQVRRINDQLGVESLANDFETYFTAKFLKNDQDPIWVDEDGPRMTMVSDRYKVTGLLELSDESIYTPKVADYLAENGSDKMAETVMREWVYSVSKLAVLKQYTDFGMYPETEAEVRSMVEDNADFVRDRVDLRHTASRRLYKAMNGNFMWFALASARYGLLEWFSPGLQVEVDKVMSDDKSFRTYQIWANEMSNQMFSGKIMEVEDFVDKILEVSQTENAEEVSGEFFANWNPGDMSGVAFQGGKRIK